MTSWWRRPGGGLSEFAVDASLALLVGVLGMAELWGNSVIRPHAVAATPLYLVMAAGVAFRRRRPLVAVAVTGVAGNLALIVGVPLNQMLVPVLAFLIVDYSVAAHCDRRGAITGLAGMVLLVWAGIAFSPSPHGLGDYANSLLQLSAAWAAGRAVRYRLHQAVSAERRAVEAEHDAAEVARQAVAREQARIARELHDIVSHGLSLMIIQAGAAERVLDPGQPQATQALEAIQDVGRDALVEMQRLLGVLRLDDADDGLAPQPSLDQLDQLITQVRHAGLPVEIRVEGDIRPLSAGLDLCLYRLIQEALTNALKHSGSAATRVTVHYGPETVDLEIIDEGRADSVFPDTKGHGLVGMRERVALYGGHIDTGPTSSGGFAVRASLPVSAS